MTLNQMTTCPCERHREGVPGRWGPSDKETEAGGTGEGADVAIGQGMQESQEPEREDGHCNGLS